MSQQGWPGQGPQGPPPGWQGGQQPPMGPGGQQPPTGQGGYHQPMSQPTAPPQEPWQQGGFISQPDADPGDRTQFGGADTTQLGTPAWQQSAPSSPMPAGYGAPAGGPGWRAPAQEKKSRLPLILAAILVLALAAGAATWWFLSQKKDEKADPPVVTSTTPAPSPSGDGSEEPSPEASEEPSPEASDEPSPEVSEEPTPEASDEPSPEPTPSPETSEAATPSPSPSPALTKRPIPDKRVNTPFTVGTVHELGTYKVHIPKDWTVKEQAPRTDVGESESIVIQNPKSTQLRYLFMEITDLKKLGVDNAASLCAIYNKPLVKALDPKTVEEQVALPLTFDGPVDVSVCGAKGINTKDGLTYDFAFTTYVDLELNKGLVVVARNNWKGYQSDNPVFKTYGQYYRCAMGEEMGITLKSCEVK